MIRSRRSSCSKPVDDVADDWDVGPRDAWGIEWPVMDGIGDKDDSFVGIPGDITPADQFLSNSTTFELPPSPKQTPQGGQGAIVADLTGADNAANGFKVVKQAAVVGTAATERPASRATQWESMLTRSITAIVSISTLQVRSFDTERASTSEASGFVVDAALGLVLSNRHVVSSGPVVAEAVLWNHEEVHAVPIYRDPVHDFGVFRVDPRRLAEARVPAIELDADGAAVGKEVRVVGNDAGEKLSILAGTLARLDRPAPTYGLDRYNDFNTHYIQAASSTSGGSSGSPVLDVRGRAVALNAGGKSAAASSYFLPLARVVRALRLLRAGAPVPRGTLQVEFRHHPYDRLRRLGLSRETEERARACSNSTSSLGMLVVHRVLPGGPATDLLQPGDILVKVGDAECVSFLQLEDVLDGSVGRQIPVQVERGGTQLSVKVVVQDLHTITPSEYVEYSGGVFHNLSYQVAMSFGIPATTGVFVADAGYAFALAEVSRFCVILAVDGRSTRTVDELVDALARVPTGERVPVRFCNLNDLHRQRVTVLTGDRQWYPFRRSRRNDRTGLWDPTDVPPCRLAAPVLTPATAAFAELPSGSVYSEAVRRAYNGLCIVTSKLPFLTDGLGNDAYIGLGLIVSKRHGLVACDKSTVPIPLADIRITFGNAAMVRGRCVFLHPVHNFALVHYDPRLLVDAPIAEIALPACTRDPAAATALANYLLPGRAVTFLGLSANSVLTHRETRISHIAPTHLSQGHVPKYRPFNFDTYGIENPPSAGFVGGVLIDEHAGQCDSHRPTAPGDAVLFWTMFSSNERGKNRASVWAGCAVDELGRILGVLTRELDLGDFQVVDWAAVRRRLAGAWGYCLDAAELWPVSLVAAQSLGLDPSLVDALARAPGNQRRNVLKVFQRQCNSVLVRDNILQEGDLIVSVQGAWCTRLRDMEIAVTLRPSVGVELLRDKQLLTVNVPLSPLDGMPHRHLVGWCGALLQDTPLEVAHFSKTVPSSVYVTWVAAGSPCECYRLYDNTFIMEVNGRPVSTLADFVSAAALLGDGAFVRLKVMDAFRASVKILAVRVNYHYFPMWEVTLDTGSEPVLVEHEPLSGTLTGGPKRVIAAAHPTPRVLV